jgi:hypothetical protein
MNLAAIPKANGIAVAIEFRSELCQHYGFLLADTEPPLQIRGDIRHNELSARRYTNGWRSC